MSTSENESTVQETPAQELSISTECTAEGTDDMSHDSPDSTPCNDGGEHDSSAGYGRHGTPQEPVEDVHLTPSTSSSDDAVLNSPKLICLETDNAIEMAVAGDSDSSACSEHGHDIINRQKSEDAPNAGTTPSAHGDSDTNLISAEISIDTVETPLHIETTERVSRDSTDGDARELADNSAVGSSTDDTPAVPYQESASTIRLRDMDDKSPSRQQWILRKEEDRQDNEALDELMLMEGFEEVKVHFLSVYDEVRAARKDENEVQHTVNLNVCFVEGNENSRELVTELYIKLLQSLAIVSADVIRTRPYCSLTEVWGKTTMGGERRILYVDDPGYSGWATLRSQLGDCFEASTASNLPVIVLQAPGSAEDLENYILKPTDKVPNMLVVPLLWTKDELLSKFKRAIKEECGTKGIAGGWDGDPFRILVSRLTAKGGLETVDPVLSSVEEVKQRRARRIAAEEKGQAPKSDETIHFTKSDMLGLSAAELGYQSPAWAELQQMIGMEEVKESVRQFLGQAALNQRLEMESKPSLGTWSNRRCFIGPPGTGKTTAAKLYSRVLKELGMLESDVIVEKRASDLIGCYVGWSEEATRKAIDDARGGVLIIDDFHTLLPDSIHNTDKTDVFRAAVIDTIVDNIDPDSKRKEAVILIGYSESMSEAFEKSNPGLARRFPLAQSFRFKPYDDKELELILEYKLRKYNIMTSGKAVSVAKEMLSIARHRPNFGNGGDVENLLHSAQAARNARCANVAVDAELDMSLIPEDFDPDWQRTLDAARRCADHFDGLQGMDDIMNQFQRYQVMTRRLRARGHDPRSHIPWALVFRGPPGTGKTTVARKMAKIYYDMGFLSEPEVIECSVADLLSSYVAGSSKRVIRMFERGLGKVLFIDEAYRLAESRAVDAIGEIVDCMTKERFFGKLVVVLAGYKEEMDEMMRWNRGLRSRFATKIDFPVLSADNALQLLQKNLAKVDILLGGIEPGPYTWSRDTILEVLAKLSRMKSWASGRDVIAISRAITEEVYTAGDERYSTQTQMVEANDVKDDDGSIANKREDERIVFHADDLVPILNRWLRRAMEEESEMNRADAPRQTNRESGKPRHNRARANTGPEQAATDTSSDNDTSDTEQLQTSLDEARNVDEVVLHGYTSFIDFVPEKVMKRILFNLSRFKPLEEGDEKKLIKWVQEAAKMSEATNRWGKHTVNAGGLCLEAMLCLSRLASSKMRDNDDEAKEYLGRAFQLAQQAVETSSSNSTDGAHAREVLSHVLFWICLEDEKANDGDDQTDVRIEKAIKATKEARDAATALLESSDVRDITARLAELLSMKYERSKKLEDLEEGMTCATSLLHMCPPDDAEIPDALRILIELSADKILHFRVGTEDDMNMAVEYATSWLKKVNDGSIQRVRILILAARLVSWRFLRSREGNMDELRWAIELQKEALGLADLHLTDRAWRSYRRELLGDMASMLVELFKAEGSRADLEKAMRFAIEGRDMTNCSGEEWKCTMALLRAREAKYNLTLDEAELDRGLKEAEAVLRLEGLEKAAKASMLDVLCDVYTNRYRMNSNEEDIQKAIRYGTMATQLYPQVLSFATSLGIAIILSYERTGKQSDFRKAMMRVAKIIQAGDGVHNGDLAHMAKASLLRIYQRTKKTVFLDYAVDAMQTSVRKTVKHQSQYEMHVSDLAECLLLRYDSNKEKYASDLDHGIRVSEESLKLRITSAYYRSATLENLGKLYHRQYEAGKPGARDESTLRKAIHHYRQGWEHGNADAASRIKSGRAAAHLLGMLGDWQEAADILMLCVRMLPRVAGLAFGDANQQHVMKRYGGLASSCAEALMNAATATVEINSHGDAQQEPTHGAVAALTYLELGRSIISRLSLEQSAEVDLLRQDNEKLAEEYVDARKKLYTFAGSPIKYHDDNSSSISPISAGKYKRQVQIEKEFEDVCARIRKETKLKHFMLPPQIDEMQSAAGDGMIIVINVGKQRSDAFLISKAGIEPKKLDDVDEESVAEAKRQDLPLLMEWFWKHVASPILSTAALPEPVSGRWPRVWWVLTGLLTGVPIHAAGLRDRPYQNSVLDRVMSSYATSVMSLLYARRMTKPMPTDTSTEIDNRASVQQQYQALLVAMGETPGKQYGDLPQAENEINAVEAKLHQGGRRSFQPVIALSDKTHAACLAALRNCSIFHFAGHAKVDKQIPSRSALLLNDHESQPLTMEMVRDDGVVKTVPEAHHTKRSMLESPPRFLAYLSACSTGAIGDPSLADEAIHLVGGMQLARFRHVVGTLWEVADWYCVQIAVKFYHHLLNSAGKRGHSDDEDLSDDGVCRALHEAIREVREGRFERSRPPVQRKWPRRGETGQQQLGSTDQDEELCAFDELEDESKGLSVLGPSRYGVSLSSHGASEDSSSTQQWSANHIMRWAPYVHYGV